MVVHPTASLLKPAYDIDPNGTPNCGTSSLMILMAQAVPSATTVPCIASLPAGWRLGGLHVVHGRGEFWLNSERGGNHAVEVNLVPARACNVAGATEVPSDEAGVRRFEHPGRLPPGLQSTRFYLFPGGCVTYRFAFTSPVSASLLFDADTALAFEPRSVLVAKVRAASGLRLCGAGAPCPGGS